jgi:hypothetical protein
MKLRTKTPPLAWIDETWPEGVACAFHDVQMTYEEAPGEPACVTLKLGGYAVSLTFPLLEALGRLAAYQDGSNAAHLAALDDGTVLEVDLGRPPAALSVIQGGRA